MGAGPRVLVVGSVNVDLQVRVERHPADGETVSATRLQRLPGGKGGNQAAALARLGADVVLHGAVGDDADGAWSCAQLVDAGVDVTGLRTVAAPTGVAVVTVDPAGGNRIIVVPGANADVTAPASVSEYDVVVTQLEIPSGAVEAVVAKAARAGVPAVLNAAPAAALSPALLAGVTVLVVNEPELAAIAGPGEPATVAAGLCEQGPAAVVVTLGAAGALVVTPDAPPATVRPPAVDVVDTTGAGDCFVAALAFEIARGRRVQDAADFACAAAAWSVTGEGARGRLPTVDDVARTREK